MRAAVDFFAGFLAAFFAVFFTGFLEPEPPDRRAEPAVRLRALFRAREVLAIMSHTLPPARARS
ncbi:hypothetical protein GCM10028833_09940 [Glycomyces tarimensis]